MNDADRALRLLERLQQGPCTLKEACLSIDDTCSPNGWLVMAVQLNKEGLLEYDVFRQVFTIRPAGLEYLEQLREPKV